MMNWKWMRKCNKFSETRKKVKLLDWSQELGRRSCLSLYECNNKTTQLCLEVTFIGFFWRQGIFFVLKIKIKQITLVNSYKTFFLIWSIFWVSSRTDLPCKLNVSSVAPKLTSFILVQACGPQATSNAWSKTLRCGCMCVVGRHQPCFFLQILFCYWRTLYPSLYLSYLLSILLPALDKVDQVCQTRCIQWTE